MKQFHAPNNELGEASLYEIVVTVALITLAAYFLLCVVHRSGWGVW